jgi:two-component system, chemotaxis family, protein-glutamate methylesterase/glutaminase
MRCLIVKSPEVDAREAAEAAVAIAASAGGLDAIGAVLRALPASLPAAVLIVQHLDPNHPSLMAEILDRRTGLPVKQAEDGELLCDGVVHLAPPDNHLTVGDDRCVHLTQSPRIDFLRPSANLLFATVARAFGPRTIAVVLTGSGSDGAEGAGEVKRRGGRVIVEDPQTARFRSMPAAAIAAGVADSVLPVEQIGQAVVGYLAVGDHAG